MKNKFSTKIKLICAILLTTFLVRDVAWAHSYEVYKNLAVTGLQNAQTLSNMKAVMKARAGRPAGTSERDLNISFGEGTGISHMMCNNVIAFHDITMCKKGPHYYEGFYEPRIVDEKNQIYINKISRAIEELRSEGIRLGPEGLKYIKRVKELEKETTFILVDMPTRLLLGGIKDNGDIFYQLSHVGKNRWIIFIPKKAMDDFDINNPDDMKQLATVLNHDQFELDLIHEEEQKKDKQTFETYEKDLDAFHDIAKKDDPFKEAERLEARIGGWIRSDKDIKDIIRGEIDEKIKDFEKKRGEITNITIPAASVSLYNVALKAMQIGYAYELIGDTKKATVYYKEAELYFLNVVNIDTAMLPVYSQMNIVRLNIFAGDYENAATEFIRIMKLEIGSGIHGNLDDVDFREGMKSFLKGSFNFKGWMYEIVSLMTRRAEESKDFDNLRKAYDASERITNAVFDLLGEENRGPPHGSNDPVPGDVLQREISVFASRSPGYNIENNIAYSTLKASFESGDPSRFLKELKLLESAIKSARNEAIHKYENSKLGDVVNLINLPHIRVAAQMLELIVGADPGKKRRLEDYLTGMITAKEDKGDIELVNAIKNNWGVGEIIQATTELAPFYTAGGLGTVMKEFTTVAGRASHLDVKIAMPLCRFDGKGIWIRDKIIKKMNARYTGTNIKMTIGGNEQTVGIYNALINGQVVILSDHELADSIYIRHKGNKVTAMDHVLRRVFLAKSILETVEAFSMNPGNIIANDHWTTFVNFYAKEHSKYKNNPRIKKIVFTTQWHNPGSDYVAKVPYVTGEGENLFALAIDDPAILNDPKKSWEIQQAVRDPYRPDLMNFGCFGGRFSNNLGVSKGLAAVMPTWEGRTGLDPVFRENPPFGIDEGIDQAGHQKRLFGSDFIKDINEWRATLDPERKAQLGIEIIKIAKERKLKAKHKNFVMHSGSAHVLAEDETRAIPEIFFMGRIVRQKGLDFLLYGYDGKESVIERTLREYPAAKFFFAGEPGDSYGEAAYERLYELKRQHKNNIFIIGLLHAGRVWDEVVLGADIHIMPSRAEPRGMTNLEGIAAGGSVVGPNIEGLVTGITDFTEHPDTGNGFKYNVNFTPKFDIDFASAADGLYDSLGRALKTFYDKTNPDKDKPGDNNKLDRLILNCITTDNSWESHMHEYMDYFRKIAGIGPLNIEIQKPENPAKTGIVGGFGRESGGIDDLTRRKLIEDVLKKNQDLMNAPQKLLKYLEDNHPGILEALPKDEMQRLGYVEGLLDGLKPILPEPPSVEKTPDYPQSAPEGKMGKGDETAWLNMTSAAERLGQVMRGACKISDNIAGGKAIVLYADDVLERGMAPDLAYTIKETQLLDNTTLVLYGRKTGRADMLERIIKAACSDKRPAIIKVSPEDFKGFNGQEDINVELPDESRELGILLKYIAARHKINNELLLGVIKGRTSGDYIKSIEQVARERHAAVVSFEHLEPNDIDKEVYSFKQAINLLVAIAQDATPLADRKWHRMLKPIEKEDIEKAYQDYRRALEVIINA